MIEPVQVYAWRASGMCNATESKRHPDDGFVKVADYRKLLRAYNLAAEDLKMANRIMERREKVLDRLEAETKNPALGGGG